MRDVTRRRLQALKNTVDFYTANAADFRDQLNDAITAFQTSVNAQSSAVDGRVGANANLEALVDAGMQIKRTLHAIVTNKYTGVPVKIAS